MVTDPRGKTASTTSTVDVGDVYVWTDFQLTFNFANADLNAAAGAYVNGLSANLSGSQVTATEECDFSGTYIFTATVTDVNGNTLSEQQTVVVTGPSQALVLIAINGTLSPTPVSVPPGTDVSVHVTVFDPDPWEETVGVDISSPGSNPYNLGWNTVANGGSFDCSCSAGIEGVVYSLSAFLANGRNNDQAVGGAEEFVQVGVKKAVVASIRDKGPFNELDQAFKPDTPYRSLALDKPVGVVTTTNKIVHDGLKTLRGLTDTFEGFKTDHLGALEKTIGKDNESRAYAGHLLLTYEWDLTGYRNSGLEPVAELKGTVQNLRKFPDSGGFGVNFATGS